MKKSQGTRKSEKMVKAERFQSAERKSKDTMIQVALSPLLGCYTAHKPYKT